MKLNYKVQMIIAVAIIIVFNILSTFFGHWIFRSIGFVISGLLYTIHPVVPQNQEDNKESVKAVRSAGIVLILIGLFTRGNY